MKEPDKIVGKDGKSYPAKVGSYDYGQIVALREAGASMQAIAERVGCSQSLVGKVLRKARGT